MEYALHEQILLFLYKHRSTDETWDLYGEFKAYTTTQVWDAALYLDGKKYIQMEYPLHFSVISRTGDITSSYSGGNYLRGRILPGGIDHVNFTLLPVTIAKPDDSLKKVLLYVAGGVLLALVLVLIGSLLGVDLL
jgi:hypothetical protein